LAIIPGVHISLLKLNLPVAIISIKSSAPAISAPAFFASSTLSASHKTAILIFLPLPFGSLTTVLKLKSPPLDCLRPIRKETSIDSSNLVVEFFLINFVLFYGIIGAILLTFLIKRIFSFTNYDQLMY
jgi:hypothetical protein